MANFLQRRFAPFQHSSFRRFFFAEGLSQTGTWSHELARSWLVLEISGTATALGVLLLSSALPGLFSTLFAGALADRSNALKIVTIAKSLLALSSLCLFGWLYFGEASFVLLVSFAFVDGLLLSFDHPSFISIFGRVVPKNDFQQALAIRSTGFHVARMTGPSVAGLIIATFGAPFVFLFDAITYLVVVFVVRRLKLREKDKEKKPEEQGLLSVFKGFAYFFKDPKMRYMQTQLLLSMLIIIPMLNLVFRTYLKSKFSLDGAEFGYLFSFPAMGAMAGAIYFILAPLKAPLRNLIFGIPGVLVSLVLIRTADTPFAAAPVLASCGFFSYINVASPHSNYAFGYC